MLVSRLPTLISIFLAVSVRAAPTQGNIALARKYAPQWRFHTSEEYWPSSVEYFLSNVDLVNSDGKIVDSNPTVSTVDNQANQGSGLYLATDIDANKHGWLRGQNPATTPSAVYTFIAPKDNGVVDLFYWMFTPFNAAKDIPVLGRIGDHVGDWERMTVRTVNGEATQVDYHAHSDTGSTIPWSQAPKFDNNKRPVGYVAQGSHGLWQSAGTFTYVNAVIFQLQDKTTDNGVYWDTKDSLVPLGYPDSFSGDLDWLNFKGRWGNRGEDDCWWNFIYSQCEVTDGPSGPLRDNVLGSARTSKSSPGSAMDGPLTQVLGEPSTSDSSSFTFYVADGALNAAQSASFIGVQQTCESIQATTNDDGQEVRETSTTFSSVPAQADSTQFTVNPAACGSEHRVRSYTIGICSSAEPESCTFPSSQRNVVAFSNAKDVNGPQDTQAINLTDLDSWRW